MRTWCLTANIFVSCFLAGPVFAASEVEEAIDAVREASAEARPALVQRLTEMGLDALEAVRAARDGERDPALRNAFERAATWILARDIQPTFRQAIETQLTFDGQYSALKERGPEVVDAILALLGDEATEPLFRLAASRALADVADTSILPRLRSLYNDILLARGLREQVGILLAVFGDTSAVDAQMNRLERMTSSPQERLRTIAFIELANLYYRIRNYKKAVESYEQILKLSRRFRKRVETRIEELLGRRKKETDERVRLVLQQTALQLEEQLKAIEEEETLHFYNAACSNTLAGNIERAKEYLRNAVKKEPSHFTNMEKDGDLSKLRAHSTYAEFRKELGKLFEKRSL